jgi:DNA-binding NtrC family response regulator
VAASVHLWNDMSQENKPKLGSTREEQISILAVVAPGNVTQLDRIVSHTRWQLQVAHSTRDAIHSIRSIPASVILCDNRLPDGTWLDVLRQTEHLQPRPQIIVLSPTPDPSLWAEVLNCGAYDVLVSPLDPREVYALVPMAWRHWSRAAAKKSFELVSVS